MRLIKLTLFGCGLIAVATLFSAGGATGVIPVSTASPTAGAALSAAGATAPSTAPSLLERTVRLTLRMAREMEEKRAGHGARFQNSFAEQDNAPRSLTLEPIQSVPTADRSLARLGADQPVRVPTPRPRP
ncbi:hypothetical protein [Palleronia pelagia]|uniref:Uncharacterized protein n=1 Tax=Palleronia pelagia TaxID=387096 RepID=A0A1H8K098_9RHOB|nr:hypothetical protein [Palleronia pelagia]SEN86449.1 hypothetical protein SAMN04488011_10739 [Palleronia pelagia]